MQVLWDNLENKEYDEKYGNTVCTNRKQLEKEIVVSWDKKPYNNTSRPYLVT